MNEAAPETSYRAQALIEEDIEAYLLQHQHKSLLRFITRSRSIAVQVSGI